jgi:hypothetical protein
MNWKGFQGSSSGLIEILSWNLPGGTEENHGSPAEIQAMHVPNTSAE